MGAARKPILCLDFDGVIHSYRSRWTTPLEINDPPTDGFFDFLIAAQDANYEVVISSSRLSHTGAEDAIRSWFWRWAPNFLDVDDFYRIDDIRFSAEKPPAMVTLDDRAMTFDGTWPEIVELKNFRPWNRP